MPALPLPPVLHNPKRSKDNRSGRSGWYEYYAGFSPTFVDDALAFASAEPGTDRILDPWNGSGTTTEVATRKGFDSIGFDLNPVTVIVAKARTLQPNVQPSLASLLEDILSRADEINRGMRNEPLGAWLTGETALSLRRIEIALQMVLIDANKYLTAGNLPSVKRVSALAAFFYVALFRLLRRVSKPFRSSNPTWIRDAESAEELVFVTKEDLISILRAEVARMAGDLATETWIPAGRIPQARLDVASSLSLPVDDGSVHVVVTSPPYCTRIDYVVKTAPELALLGLGNDESLRDLRDSMIGTPTIGKKIPIPSEKWGTTCLGLLDSVSQHTSRASKSYYLKTQIQYFEGLYKSLAEINRVLACSGRCFFVVQDSYYKELRIDLAQIVSEMGSSLGWTSHLRQDFACTRTMVGLNRGARVYNDPPKPAVESVLHFTKENAVAG
jgi:hypothetical protein